jgi:2-aminoadipate transaminase
MNSNIKLAHWITATECSAMQKLLARNITSDFISFSLGLPAADFFPLGAYQQAFNAVIAQGPNLFQYAPPLLELKKHIVTLMQKRQVTCSLEQIFLTTGAQQGLSLLAKLLVNHKDTILTETLVYPGLLQAVAPLQPNFTTVPTDLAQGINLFAIEKILKTGCRPAFIYTMADGHNPLSLSMPLQHRIALTDMSQQYEIPIIEDDPYGLLQYGQALPSLKHFGGDWVFYVGSFSKIIAPSLRIGWLVVPEAIVSKLAILKEGADIDTATFNQYVVAKMLDERFLNNHLDKLCYEYKLRRDTMVQSLQQYFTPNTVSFTVPNSGLFIWLRLPSSVNTTELFNHAIHKENVAFIPGNAFAVHAHAEENHYIRLNFSFCNTAQIDEGISRLARAVKHFTEF